MLLRRMEYSRYGVELLVELLSPVNLELPLLRFRYNRPPGLDLPL